MKNTYDFSMLQKMQREARTNTEYRNDVDTLSFQVKEKKNIDLELELRRIVIRKMFLRGYKG